MAIPAELPRQGAAGIFATPKRLGITSQNRNFGNFDVRGMLANRDAILAPTITNSDDPYANYGNLNNEWAGMNVIPWSGGFNVSRPNAKPGDPYDVYDGSGRFVGSGKWTNNIARHWYDSSLAEQLIFGGGILGAGALVGAGMGAAAGAAGAGEAGAGAASASGAGGSLASGAGLGTAGGTGLTGTIGAAGTGAGYGVGTLPGLAGASYGAGSLGLDSAMAGMGSAGAAGATATMGGAPEASGGYNAAADSQLANQAIDAGGGDALSGYTSAGIPSVTVNGAPSGGLMDSIKSGIGDFFGGSGSGGFDWTKLIGPALNAGAGIYGAGQAKSAADAQLQAAREAQAKLEPWYKAGGNALNRLQEELGIGGDATSPIYGRSSKDFGMADFNADPGYAFRKSEQEQALQRAASASGGLGSGKYLKDAMSYSGGLASQEYNNSFNRFQTSRTNRLNPLQSLAGQGQSAAGTVADLSTQAGNAVAAGKVGQANALTNAIGQGYSMYENNRLMDRLLQPRGY